MFICDTCAYDVKGCCDYNEPLGRFCVLGSAYKPKQFEQITIFEILEEEDFNGSIISIREAEALQR